MLEKKKLSEIMCNCSVHNFYDFSAQTQLMWFLNVVGSKKENKNTVISYFKNYYYYYAYGVLLH